MQTYPNHHTFLPIAALPATGYHHSHSIQQSWKPLIRDGVGQWSPSIQPNASPTLSTLPDAYCSLSGIAHALDGDDSLTPYFLTASSTFTHQDRIVSTCAGESFRLMRHLRSCLAFWNRPVSTASAQSTSMISRGMAHLPFKPPGHAQAM